MPVMSRTLNPAVRVLPTTFRCHLLTALSGRRSRPDRVYEMRARSAALSGGASECVRVSDVGLGYKDKN